MASRSGGGFNPSRGGRRVAPGGRKARKSSGLVFRFAAIVAAGTALLWLVDRPVPAAKLGSEGVLQQPGVDAG